ncbi:Por secretion system C-terminal sorting domain-containing protein [Lutibacter oricola]|uniref:Por secretion system C-terminal sorting domain-containing protein n=1 Tax=Lutibacter oricola TaxID=762486 RepID=A0A1H3DDV9_9FLAO|nr:LamG-like jellyroll fold domain-containing protein [Lutibacter oricola]SDX64692.1 Por secretion system C-terminal sorting domain-containing protein [Lutibacter oricola]
MKLKTLNLVKVLALLCFFLSVNYSFAQVTIIDENFENDATPPAAIWTAGGLGYVSNGNTIQGSRSLRVIYNSGQTSSSPTFNAGLYSSIDFSFSFRPAGSMEDGDAIIVEFYNGASWSTVASFVAGGAIGQFSQNNNHNSGLITINSPTGTNAQLRFSISDNSGNSNERFFFDEVLVRGWSACTTYSLISTSVSTPVCQGNSTAVTLNSNSTNLPDGTYTVTYNLTGDNTATGQTATVTMSGGVGTFNTANLTNSGSTTVTITDLDNGTCNNSISTNNTAVVTVNTPPTEPTISSNITICNGDSTNLVGTSSGNTINWYTVSTGGTSIGSSASGTNFNVNPSSTITYYAESENGSGCSSSSRASVIITVNSPTITGTTPNSRIGTGTVTLGATASSGATISWYANASGGTALATGTSYTTPSISSTTTYYVEANNGGCISLPRTAIVATINTLSYCSTLIFTSDVEPITNVTFNTINYTTSATVNGTPGLEDFTSVSTSITQNGTYSITVEGNTAGPYTNHFRVFYDWNQDGDFIDTGESFYIGSISSSTGVDGIQASTNITVPATATLGSTVMRVVKAYNTDPTNPCGSYSYGQAEDYTVNIISSGPQPEINVQGNSTDIADGNTSISTTDDTDFGNVDITTGSVTHTYTVENTGTADLTVSNITSSNSLFTVSNITFSSVISGSNFTTFDITFNPNLTQTETSTIIIFNDDSNEDEYTFNVEGVGTTPIPEIDVLGLSTSIIGNGTNTPIIGDGTDFGTINTGSSSTITYTIENTGMANLNLTGSPIVAIAGASEFAVTSQPIASTIVAGNLLTFQVTYTPTLSGVTNNAVVSIINNDGDEGTYTFNIEGTGFTPVSVGTSHTIYYENFDDNNGNWTVTNPGGNTVWTYGVNTYLDATEGSHWYTSNYASYANDSKTYVTSPTIDLTGFTNLEFRIDYLVNTESTYDGMNIEYSINGGTTWQVLGAYSASPIDNWYNDTDVDGIGNNIDGWTGNPYNSTKTGHSDFQEAKISLPNSLNNRSNVLFRVQFGSDSGTVANGVNFDNVFVIGEYITPPSDPSLAPGGVTTNLKLWLKANKGTNTTVDGNSLAVWNDLASDNDAVGISTTQPIYNDNATENINFNPVVNFDNAAGYQMRGKGGYFSQDYFIVVQPDITYNAVNIGQQPLAGKFATEGFSVDGTGLAFGQISARYTDAVMAHTISSFPETGGPNATSYGRAYQNSSATVGGIMLINVKTNLAGDSSEIYVNGEQIDNAVGKSGNGSDLNFNEFNNLQYYLGTGRFTTNGHSVNSHLDGKISEVLSYSGKNSTLDQQKVLSSLAIKYGITLHRGSMIEYTDMNYLASDNTVIWDASEGSGLFNYNIAGIGRDDNSELHQKQSKTVNTVNDITIGLEDILATNNLNANTFTTDRNFLCWGHDNESLNTASPIIVDMSSGILPAGSLETEVEFTSVQRTWKVRKTGSDSYKSKVSIPETMLSATLTPPGDYLMFISDTPTFNPTSEYRVMTTNGINLEALYEFEGTKYITFGFAPERTFVRSIQFDGVNNYLDAGNTLDLNSSEFTVSAWIKRNNTNASILSKRDAGFTTGYDLGINNSGRVEMSWNGGSDSITSSIAIPTTEWHQIAVIFDGSDAKLYIDGVEDTSVTKSINNQPIANNESFLIAAADGEEANTTSYFQGNIDEVRIWDVALTEDELRYIMNQELEENSTIVAGTYFNTTIGTTPSKAITIPWSNLQAYYPMSTYTFTNCKDNSGNGNTAALKHLTTVDYQTAPLPYVSASNGDWDTNSTWTNGNVQTIPGAASIVDNAITVDWNIVQISSNVDLENNNTAIIPSTKNGERSVLGLIIDDTFNLNVIGTNPTDYSPGSGTGYGISVSHYLGLDGKIDLQGESQLVQTDQSDLTVGTNGILERDQQGEGNRYRYNDWSSPVYTATSTIASEIAVNGTGNYTTIADGLRDGTDPNAPVPINFTTSQDGAAGTPISISTHWMYKYANLPAADYSSWDHIGSTGRLYAGEGFLMKGPGDSGAADQNFVFVGKPNNGTIQLQVNGGYDYLVGNPYPSAMHVVPFIMDNQTTFRTGAIHLWDHYGGNSHTLGEYRAGYATLNAGGFVPASAHSDVSSSSDSDGNKDNPGQFIPVGQGFFVWANATGGIIEFNNNQRAFVTEATTNSTFLRGGTTNRSNGAFTDLRPKIRVGFDGPEIDHRQLLLTVDENTTEQVDYGYDAEIYDIINDDMYWLIGDGKFVIQAVGELSSESEIPLGIRSVKGGLLKIKIDEVENLDDSFEIYLKDNVTNETFDIRNTTFEVTQPANTNLSERYSIVFKPSETLDVKDEILATGFMLYFDSSNSEIKINNPKMLDIYNVDIYNMLGQQVTSNVINKNLNNISVPVSSIASGVYLIECKTYKGSFSKKIIIE